MAAEGLSGLVPYAVNFSIVAGAYFYFGRKHLHKYLYQRHERQKDLVESAVKAKRLAESRFLEIQEKLKTLNEQVKAIDTELEQEALREVQQIRERTVQDTARIKTDSERIIRNEEEQLAQKLRAEVISLAVAKAETSLQSVMKTEDHRAIIKTARKRIEAEASHG